MTRLSALCRDFARARDGATVVEYALIAGLVSIVIVTAATQIGMTVRGFFDTVAAAF